MRFCFLFCLILLLHDNFYGHGASRFVFSKSNRHYSMKVEFDPNVNVPDSVCVYFSFTNKTKDKYQILFPFVLLIGLNSEGYNVALIDELGIENPDFKMNCIKPFGHYSCRIGFFDVNSEVDNSIFLELRSIFKRKDFNIYLGYFEMDERSFLSFYADVENCLNVIHSKKATLVCREYDLESVKSLKRINVTCKQIKRRNKINSLFKFINPHGS